MSVNNAKVAHDVDKEVGNMQHDLLTEENVTAESLKAIFDGAYMETSFDSDGDLKVKDRFLVLVIPKKDKIRFLAFFGLEPNVSWQKRLETVNKINAEYIMVRTSAPEGRDSIIADYDLLIAGGVTKVALVQAFKRFQAVIAEALGEHVEVFK